LSLTALVASSAILTEAGMSYLGLGDPNLMSWGGHCHVNAVKAFSGFDEAC
jgi:ABC-type dipeptide/oligopeptide/nickel transport system permease subunit